MQTFLGKAADHILQQHPTLAQIELIVPTRRATVFLQQALAERIGSPQLSPSIRAMDDFVAQHSQLQIADSVSLLFTLFEAFREVDEKVVFEQFINWGSMLLSDLDRIDQYLIDPEYLFGYLTEAKALERWDPQQSASGKVTPGPIVAKYFKLFAQINEVYPIFKAKLNAMQMGYRGMAYRHLAEQTPSLLLDQLTATYYYFLGFNAFTPSEKALLQPLIKAKRAELLWDTDAYYMSKNPIVEAGTTLRAYKREGLFGPWKWEEDLLCTDTKEIKVYGVPNATLQTKVAGALYKQLQAADLPEQPIPTAIVLADEHLVVPMLYALDEDVEELNITMGLTLRNSLLNTLIESIFELQQNVRKINQKDGTTRYLPQFNHKSIRKVLNHPFVRYYEQVAMQPPESDQLTPLQRILQVLTVQNRVYLTSAHIQELCEGEPLLSLLFTHWKKDDIRGIITSFYRLIDLLRGVYKEQKNAMETEYLYLFYTLLHQLEETLTNRQEPISLRTLKLFLFDLIRQTRIPFSGEPISDLQILGMLETRALDFERIIMLSLNEGILPQAKKQTSLIPTDIALEIGLPTYKHQEAVMSYHFYRLLQRAKDVHLLYVNTQDAPGGPEKSRFIQQLDYELTAYNPHLQVKHFTVSLPKRDETPVSEQIEKDEALLDAIETYLTEKGLYPTHLNRYINCSMQFYYQHIVGVQDKEEIEETLGMDKIGSWLHGVLETLDLDFYLQGLVPSESQIKEILRQQFDEQFGGYVTDIGLNRIYYQLGEQQVLRLLDHLQTRTNTRVPLATEQELSHRLNVPLANKNLSVKIGGKIDRVEFDEKKQTLHIMDYKVGKVALLSQNTKSVVTPEQKDEYLLHATSSEAGYVRQLWLYQYLLYRSLHQEGGWSIAGQTFNASMHRVRSGFYSLRYPTKDFENPLQLTEEEETAATYLAQSERLLQNLIHEMLDPRKPIVKTDNLNTCTHCDFKKLCGRD